MSKKTRITKLAGDTFLRADESYTVKAEILGRTKAGTEHEIHVSLTPWAIGKLVKAARASIVNARRAIDLAEHHLEGK